MRVPARPDAERGRTELLGHPDARGRGGATVAVPVSTEGATGPDPDAELSAPVSDTNPLRMGAGRGPGSGHGDLLHGNLPG